jgi:hypothetical protein
MDDEKEIDDVPRCFGEKEIYEACEIMKVTPDRLADLIHGAELTIELGHGLNVIEQLALDLRDAMEAVKILNELKYKTEAGEPLKNGFYG